MLGTPISILHRLSAQQSMGRNNITGPYFAALKDGDGRTWVHKRILNSISQLLQPVVEAAQPKRTDLLQELQTRYGGLGLPP